MPNVIQVGILFIAKPLPHTSQAPFASRGPANIIIASQWGPRQPGWKHTCEYMTYLARTQFMMRQGRPKHDVAIVHQHGAIDSNMAGPWFTSEGGRLGWSADFINPSLFDLPTARVENNRFAPDAGNYSLIALQGNPSDDFATVLQPSAAKKLLKWAQEGLPVLLVGNWSQPTAWGAGDVKIGGNKEVQEIFNELLGLPNVANALSIPEIPETIEQMGIHPAVRHEDSSLVHLRRQDGRVDHYIFVANSTDEGVDQIVSVPRRYANAAPISLDAWTGMVSVLPQYEEVSDDHISFPVKLNPNQATLISMVPMEASKSLRRAINSTAPYITRDADHNLVVRATTSGTYSTTLNDGSVRKTTFENVQAALPLEDWTLVLEDWLTVHGNGTKGNITETRFEYHEMGLEEGVIGLAPWRDLPGLQDVSGIGVYNATFDLGSDSQPLAKGEGDLIRFESFEGSLRLKLNGDLPRHSTNWRWSLILAHTSSPEQTISRLKLPGRCLIE